MANGFGGPLALPETDDPLQTSLQQPTPAQLQARQAGALPPQQAGALPLGSQPPNVQPQQQFQGFGGQGGMDQLKQIYGLLAQYGDNPERIGQGYVTAVQNQQRLARENQPLGRWIQLYGKINPHDYDPDSIQNFHDNLVKTGQVNYRLLSERKSLSDTETKMLAAADSEAQDISLQMMRAQQLAQEYEALHRQGISGGVVADVKRWVSEKMGRQDEQELVYREFDDLKNSSVITNLPPGVASDRDIEIAMRGWPGATAKPSHVAAFLRGRQKMLAVQHAAKAHESYFLSRHRTRAGLMSDWNEKQNFYVADALDRFGGVYIPLDANGNPLSADMAADAYFTRQASVQGTAPQTATQPVAPTTPVDRRGAAMQKYNLQ